MKTPVVLVTLMLATAILLAASLLYASGTRGEDALWPLADHKSGRAVLPQPEGGGLRPRHD
jgi:hypothetical protein